MLIALMSTPRIEDLYRTYLRSNICSTSGRDFGGRFADTLEQVFVLNGGAGYSFDRWDDETSDYRHSEAAVSESEERAAGTRRRTSLSEKQQAILEVIQRSNASRGYPPSMRE